MPRNKAYWQYWEWNDRVFLLEFFLFLSHPFWKYETNSFESLSPHIIRNPILLVSWRCVCIYFRVHNPVYPTKSQRITIWLVCFVLNAPPVERVWLRTLQDPMTATLDVWGYVHAGLKCNNMLSVISFHERFGANGGHWQITTTRLKSVGFAMLCVCVPVNMFCCLLKLCRISAPFKSRTG